MPYTPPSHPSPVSSATSSPFQVGRRSSFHAIASATSGSRFSLPRSSSYLKKHRRTPSAPVTLPSSTGQSNLSCTSGMITRSYHGHGEISSNRSLRQSPPPVTGEHQAMPAGAVMSPPESPSCSSDDEELTEVRGRQIDNLNELKQLHEAISQLPRRRESSPSEAFDAEVVDVRPFTFAGVDLIHRNFSTGSLDELSRRASTVGSNNVQGNGIENDIDGSSGSVSSSGRRVSHIRSATEPNIPTTPSVGSLNSDDENDLETAWKPQMVRKKSGELVRPALRHGTHRRPSSMPGTPTFSKMVHFDSHLEHVRHFLQVDRPLAVSAGSSPVETYDSESEYPFNISSRPSPSQSQRRNAHEWEIILHKFPLETPERKALPVRLERVWLSADQKSLHGSIAVLNLSYSKSVVCRFTLDYWKTTSEVAAEYSSEILPRVATQGHDRFNFTIKLSDLANLESKTLYFCIRYSVNGQDFWDNNNDSNFQVDFRKKVISGSQGGHGLPRSSRRPNPSTAPRPVSLPASLDDFGEYDSGAVDRSLQDYLGEPIPALRLKSLQSATSLASDNLTSRLSSPSGQAFANRYDFGASLSAAKQANKGSSPIKHDGLYMKPSYKLSVETASAPKTLVPHFLPESETKKRLTVSAGPSKMSSVPASLSGLDRDTRAILAGSGALYGSDSIASQSYEEIVSKYCFYVPKQPNQLKDAALQVGQIDGAFGELVTQARPSPSSSISEGSPLQISRLHHHLPTALHHSVHIGGSSVTMVGGYASPVSSLSSASSSASSSPREKEFQSQPRSMLTTAAQSTHRSVSTESNDNDRSAAPTSTASLVGGFPSFTDASSPPEYTFQHLQDRFPFNTVDAHSATAIKG